MARIVDTHLHFWDIHRFDYRWMKPGTPLHRNFLPDDISDQAREHGVEGYIVIEATNTSEEIPWLLNMAEHEGLIKGVVGGGDFTAYDVLEAIHEHAQNPLFKGMRLNWLHSRGDAAELTPALQILAAHQLSCDVLNRIEFLPEIQAVAKKHPEITFVLNHFAGETLTPDGYVDWGLALQSLAALPNVTVKVSGFLTACDPKPIEQATLKAYVETALALFGSNRLMYASNFPINVLVSAHYGDPITLLQSVTGDLSQEEQHDLWQGTAQRVYSL